MTSIPPEPPSSPAKVPARSWCWEAANEGVLYALDTNHLGHLGDGHAIQHIPGDRIPSA